MSEKESTEKCFVIMPISDQQGYPEGHFTKVYEQIFKPAIEKAGYEAYRVDENVISNPIIGKIFEALYECKMSLCDLSSRNPNVLYELGIRQAYDKPVVLVQDDKTERIFDVSGISTVEYKSTRLYEDVIAARDKIADAIRETKEGKKNSIVKIVKAHRAEISTDALSKEDRLEIMLSSLMEDIKELKSATNKTTNFYNLSATDSEEFPDEYEIFKGKSRVYYIRLKSGVTNREVEKRMAEITENFNIKMSWKRNGNVLKVIFDEDIPFNVLEQLFQNINDKSW